MTKRTHCRAFALMGHSMRNKLSTKKLLLAKSKKKGQKKEAIAAAFFFFCNRQKIPLLSFPEDPAAAGQ